VKFWYQYVFFRVARENVATEQGKGSPYNAAGIVCMHRDFSPADAMSVGMFVQTLCWRRPHEA
jgi:hypothetical protein